MTDQPWKPIKNDLAWALQGELAFSGFSEESEVRDVTEIILLNRLVNAFSDQMKLTLQEAFDTTRRGWDWRAISTSELQRAAWMHVEKSNPVHAAIFAALWWDRAQKEQEHLND